jgi:hypothetical protein
MSAIAPSLSSSRVNALLIIEGYALRTMFSRKTVDRTPIVRIGTTSAGYCLSLQDLCQC